MSSRLYRRLVPAWSALAAVAALCAAAARADIHVEPYLQDPQTDAMSVLWWTDDSQPDSRVTFGRGSLNQWVPGSNEYVPSMDKYVHEARLTGLLPETRYDYRAVSGPLASEVYGFTTAVRRSSDFAVSILGDGRTDNDQVIADHRAVLSRAALLGPDLVFEIGDMVHFGTATHWDALYRRIVTATDASDPGIDLGSRVPYHTAVGNHEIYDGTLSGGLDTSMARYKAFASNSANGSSNPDWEERYYSMEYGCATFIVLDTNNTSSDEHDNSTEFADGTTPDWEPGSEQYDWMIEQLRQARRGSALTFVMMHPSPYSRGFHGDPTDTVSGYQLRVLEPIFRQYGVDAVITSHDHTVEHCLTGPPGFEAEMDGDDPNNLHWLVQGNSGQTARPASPDWRTWMDILDNDAEPFYSMWFYDWEGAGERSFLHVEVTREPDNAWRASFRTVQADGDVFDEFSILRPDVPEPATAALLVAGMLALLGRRRRQGVASRRETICRP